MILGFWEINHIKKGLPKSIRNPLLCLTKPLSIAVAGVLIKQLVIATRIIDYQLIMNKTARVFAFASYQVGATPFNTVSVIGTEYFYLPLT